jgi:glycosyltransferase involved in cell wall biosynthesis
MIQYFFHPGNNKILEVPILSIFDRKKLEKQGYILATMDQRDRHIAKKQAREEDRRKAVQENPDMLHLQYVSANSHDGYGYTSRYFEDKLIEKGIYLDRAYTGQKIGLCYLTPPNIALLETPIKILYTMFESTKFPDHWEHFFRQADYIWVPTTFCQKIIKDQFGLFAELVPLGYDPDTFRYVERRRSGEEPYTFLHYDAFKSRKGWDLVFNAFTQEFQNGENVKLIFKTTAPREPLPFDQYKNIEIVKAILDNNEMLELMRRSDCFVFPSLGEGFGLPPLEAMVTGMYTIASSRTGMADFVKPTITKYEKVWAEYDSHSIEKGKAGYQYKPDLSELRQAMRYAYENRPSIRYQYAEKKTLTKTINLLEKKIKDIDSKVLNLKTYRRKIVLLTEDGTIYSGGRYYTWQLAIALQEAGFNVHVYTNRVPTFLQDFQEYQQPTIHVVPDVKKVDTDALFYIASPLRGITRALELGKQYNRPCYVLIFDPKPTLEQYKHTEREQEWEEAADAIKQSSCKIVTIADFLHKDIKKWLGKSDIRTIYPAVNNKAIDEAESEKKQPNWVTYVSRLDKGKNVDHVLDAVKGTGLHLQIITSQDNVGIQKMIEERDMQELVTVRWDISDKDKFTIIKQSLAVINGSQYEGFGIWAAEAISCGVPVVAYDFPAFKEIQKKTASPNFYFARYKDKEDLREELKKAVQDNKAKKTNAFNFSCLTHSVKSTFPKYPDFIYAKCDRRDVEIEQVKKYPPNKRIAFVNDYTIEQHHGGLQQRIETLRDGYGVGLITPENEKDIDKYDSFIIGNLWKFTDEFKKNLLNRQFVMMSCDMQGYYTSYWRPFYERAQLVTFSSSRQRDLYATKYKMRATALAPSPVDPLKYTIKKNVKRKPNTVIVPSVITHIKNTDVAVKYAKDYPNKSFTFCGKNMMGQDGEELIREIENLPNCSYIGEQTPDQMIDLYNSHTDALFIPDTHNTYETFGRVPVEAYLCGCNLIHNGKYGAYEDYFRFNDREQIIIAMQQAPQQFWNLVENYV